MKAFIVLSALVALSHAGVILPYAVTQTGEVSGPVHPAFGDLVATNRGLRPLHLEGFSEDDDNNGFVDPIGQAAVYHHAPAVYHHAPAVYHHAPVVAAAPAPAPAPVAVEAPEVKTVAAAAPVLTYAHAAPFVHHVAAPAVVHPAPAVTYTVEAPAKTVIAHTAVHHAPVVTTHHLGYVAPTFAQHALFHPLGLPLAGAPAEAAPEAEAAVEEA